MFKLYDGKICILMVNIFFLIIVNGKVIVRNMYYIVYKYIDNVVVKYKKILLI